MRDAVLRAARNTSHGQTHIRKRLHMQPLQWAMRRLLRSELLDLRRCERTMLLRVRTRGSAAVLRAARSPGSIWGNVRFHCMVLQCITHTHTHRCCLITHTHTPE